MVSMSKNLFVTLCDSNFLNHSKALLSGLVNRCKWDGDIAILCDNIDDDRLTDFKKKGIIIIKNPPLFEYDLCVKTFEKWGNIVFNKYYLFGDYFKKWDKIIYMDVDFVMHESINNLLNLGGINMPSDFTSVSINFNSYKHPNEYAELAEAYDMKHPNFNVGLMVIDTKQICDDSLISHMVSLTKKNFKILQMPEQAIINMVFKGRINIIPAFYASANIFCYKKIVAHHCWGVNKQWDKDSILYDTYRKDLAEFDLLKVK